jgi:hypothetical protein
MMKADFINHAYHFLDESGDAGIKQSGTSSPFFILAMIELPARGKLAELAFVRQRLGLPDTYEFKYYRAKNSYKEVFFTTIQSLPFQARAIVLNKAQAPHEFLGMNGPTLTIELIVRLALNIPESEMCDDVLIIDAATRQLKRNLRRRLSKACRRHERKRPFKKIVGQNSRNSDGLQLADMIAGAIRQDVTGEESRYRSLIEDKLVGFWQV